MNINQQEQEMLAAGSSSCGFNLGQYQISFPHPCPEATVLGSKKTSMRYFTGPLQGILQKFDE